MLNSVSGAIVPAFQRLNQAVKTSPKLTLLVKISSLFACAMLGMLIARYCNGSTKPVPPPKPNNGKISADSASSSSQPNGNASVSLVDAISSFSPFKSEPHSFYLQSQTLASFVDMELKHVIKDLKKITLSDGSSLPLNPDDILMKCKLAGNTPSKFIEHFLLPISFLRKHIDGEPFTIKYENQTFTLQLDQTKHCFLEGRMDVNKFLTSAESIKQELTKFCPRHLAPTLSNSYPFYTLQDGGFIYKAGENGRIELNPETTELRKLKKPNCGVQWSTTSREVRHVESGRGNHPLDTPAINSTGHLLIATRTFTGGTIRNVDVVLTPTHLMLYGNYENRKAGNKITIGNEILVDIQWQHYFQDLSYEEMQEKMLNSSVFCKDGLLQLNVGFRYPTDSELDAMDYIPEWKLKGMMAANSVEFQDHPSIENTPDSIESAPDDEIQEWEPEGKAVDLVELVDQILGPMQETTQLPSPLPESETATPNEHFPIRVSQEMDDRN